METRNITTSQVLQDEDNSGETRTGNGRKKTGEILTEELARIGDNSPQLLSALHDWVTRERTKTKSDSNLIAMVEASIDQGDIHGACLAMLSTQKTPQIHGSMGRTIKSLRNMIFAASSDDKETVVERGRASITFTLGGASHRICEPLKVGKEPVKLGTAEFDLKIEEGKVVGLVENGDQKYWQPELRGESEPDQTRLLKEKREIVFEYPLKAPDTNQTNMEWASEIFLQTFWTLQNEHGEIPSKPFDIEQVFDNPESLSALMKGLEAAHFIFGVDHGLDMTKWDNTKKIGSIVASEAAEFPVLDWLAVMRNTLAAAYGNQNKNKNEAALIELPEGDILVKLEQDNNTDITEIVKGNKVDIIRLKWATRDNDNYTGETTMVDFAALGEEVITNPFGAFSDLVGGYYDEPDFSKLYTGNFKQARLLVKYLKKVGEEYEIAPYVKEKVEAWDSELEARISRDHLDLSLSVAVEHIVKSKFNSQERRYRRKGVVEGNLKEISTLNLRNARTLFKELYKIYGERIFTDLEITVDDLKFPAGDGGWFEQYDPEDLPKKEHVSQVSGYLFKIMTQLYWVKKWSSLQDSGKLELMHPNDSIRVGEMENFSININDVSEFIVKYNLADRIKGRLLYQLPGKEIVKEVTPQILFEDIVAWGNNIFNIPKRIEARDRLQVLRVLERILKPQIQNLKVVDREVKSMPKEMASICTEYRGNIYLCIEKLSELLEKRLMVDVDPAEIKNMVLFKDSDTRVLWVDDFIEGVSKFRIAVDKNGKYLISYYQGDNHIHFSGKLQSEIKMKGVSESANKLDLFYASKVWSKIEDEWKIFRPLVSEQSILLKNGHKIIFPDGSIKDVVDGKPVVCLWNPMGGGRWYLDSKLLKEAIETDSSHKDLYGLNQLASLVNDKYPGQAPILCPMPTHANMDKTSKAGQWYGGSEPHIACFGDCDVSIDLNQALHIQRSPIKVEPVATGETVMDFRPPSEDRQKTFRTTLTLAGITEKISGIGKKYLNEVRGLSTEDVGVMGYVPMDIAKALTNLVGSRSFMELKKKNNHLRLDQIRNALSTYKVPEDSVMLAALSEIIATLEVVKEDDREILFSTLTTGALDDMYRRGVIESKKKQREDEDTPIESRNRLGGRLILPTYFINPYKKDVFESIVPSNINARGITIDGVPLFEGNPQHKARIRQGKKVRDGVRLLDTPAGFWARDWQAFIDNVNKKKAVILFEGPMDAPSFGRINPGYKDNALTNIGFNYHYLFPALRYFGIAGDEDSPGQGFGMGIKTIYLAYDFDATGVDKFYDRSEKLKIIFPEVEVLPVHALLPDDVLKVVPQYDPKLFAKADPEKGIEAGPLLGTKLDFNELINISAESNPALKPIRDKYAYKA